MELKLAPGIFEKEPSDSICNTFSRILAGSYYIQTWWQGHSNRRCPHVVGAVTALMAYGAGHFLVYLLAFTCLLKSALLGPLPTFSVNFVSPSCCIDRFYFGLT